MKLSAVFLALAISAAAAPIEGSFSSKAIEERQTGFDFGSFSSSIPSSGTSSLGSLRSFGSTGSSTGSSLGLLGGSSTTGTSTTTGSSTTSATSPSSTSGSSTPSTGSSGSSGSCKAVTLLFARGTGESDTMGTVIGPPLGKALAAALGDDKVASEGVDYPADFAGNLNQGATGGKVMASQAQTILTTCPSTKLVLSGYSQGAMVVHNALSAQGLDGSNVAAIVAFGDPFNGRAFKGVDASKVKEFCGSADSLCLAGGTSGSGTSHISYGGDADAAAEFIVGVVGE